MRSHYISALPAALLLSVAAYAQQAATAPAPTAAPAPAAATAAAPAASMSRHCDKAVHKAGSADKTAMPMMRDDCKAATANADKKKARAKRHDHGQFHKNS